MITKIIMWSAIAALVEGAFVRSLPSHGLLTQLVVVAAAVVVLTQAATMRRYIWMTLFLVAACVLSPVFPLAFSIYMFGMMNTLTVLLFFFSLDLLNPGYQ